MKVLQNNSIGSISSSKTNGNKKNESKTHNDLVDQIKNIPINQIIGEEVSLKKQGSSYVGLCPFHDDKKPSLSVSNVKGIYKCFSCDTGGDAIDFTMRFKNMDFKDTIEHIANKNSIVYSPKVLSEEEIEKENLKHLLYNIHQKASDFFVTELIKSNEAKEYVDNRISEELQLKFKIGYAPKGKSLYKHLKQHGYDEETLIKTGLIKKGDDGSIYDFFRNRLIFPIKNTTGNIVAFSGRTITDSENSKAQKYINSPASEIYNKSKELYGFYEAIKAIHKEQSVIIVEGYTDCLRMHSIGIMNVVALCSLSLTDHQIGAIKKHTDKVILILDSDQAGSGQNGMHKIAENLIKNEFNVYTYEGIPRGEDPDSYFAANDYSSENEIFYLTGLINYYSNKDLDPAEKETAFEKIVELLYWHSTVQQESLIHEISKKFKAKITTIKDKLKKHYKSIDVKDFSFDNVPAYVKNDQLLEKYGFWVSIDDPKHIEKYPPNTYVFKDDVMTNFILKPLHHIIDPFSQLKSFRTFEIINNRNQKAIIHLSSEDLSSLANFKKKIENIGNYKLKPGFKLKQLEQLKQYWLDETVSSIKVIRLGWQNDGFWAWANGITTVENEFIPTDEFGIVKYNNSMYFIEASSNSNKKQSQNLLTEQRFKYIENEICINEVAKQMTKVFGEQARISLAFYVASIFSDLLFNYRPELPIHVIYGPKSTGKNNHANAMLAFFGIPQEALNLKTATRAALSRHMGEFNNSLFLIDEYKNKIAEDFFLEDLKGIYNRIGRQKMDTDTDKKTSTPISSMGVLIGQEIPNIDSALLSRVIFLEYKEKESYSIKENQEFNKLQELIRRGYSHITAKIIQLRPLVENNFKTNYDKTGQILTEKLSDKKNSIPQRIINSYQTILSCFACVENHINCGFSFEDLLDTCIKAMIRQSKLGRSIGENNDFWKDFEVLNNSGNNENIAENVDYKIDYDQSLNTYIIAFSFEQVFSKIASHRTKSREKSLDKVSQKNYLINSNEYIKSVKSMRIGDSNTSRLIFDYLKVIDKYGVNLHNKLCDTDTKDKIDNYLNNDSTQSSNEGLNLIDPDEPTF